jgi:O-acetyl-ADP-ribose deacetylase (regulator of RNase III)
MVARLVDITTLRVDAIVNAANTELSAGSGVCGSIYRAAGPQLAAACSRLAPCPVGEARLTPGFGSLARYIIHAVGPRWQGGRSGEAELLASAYRSSLALAKREGCLSIAFPAISTGVYGYPVPLATKIAIATVRDELAKGGPVAEVIFACYSLEILREYVTEGL